MRIYLYDQVASTNDLMKEKALAGEPEGTMVVAESQTAGRGRYGRSWVSPTGKGLYCSILLRPPASFDKPALLSCAASLAVVAALRRECRIHATVKWPNDVLIDGKKAAGILLETHYQDQRPVFIIVGIGLNLFPAVEVQIDVPGATAVHQHSKRRINKDGILKRLWEEFFAQYHFLLNTATTTRLRERWVKHCHHMNKPVVVRNHQESLHGIFCGLDSSGAAMIELDTGELVLIHSGDFSLREEACC